MSIDKIKEYTIFVPSSRPMMQRDTQALLNSYGLDCVMFDGTGYPSFSKLINDCIVQSPTDKIIICNDKSRPTIANFEKMISLLDEGYGFVGLYAFGFFGFEKCLIDKVGFFDERFINGEYEDCDFFRRMILHDVAMYNNYEISYIECGSSWSGIGSKSFFDKKYIDATKENPVCIKKLPEENYNYNLVFENKKQYKPWKDSQLFMCDWFRDVKVIEQ
jgi:hypothetical protein